MRRAVGINLLAVTGSKLLVAFSPLFLIPVLTARWSLSLYAFWVLVSTVPQFIAMGELGFGTAAGNEMTMLVARGEYGAASMVYRSARVVVLSSSLALLALSMLLSFGLPEHMLPFHQGLGNMEARMTLLFLMLYAVTWLQSSIYFAAFRCSGLFAIGDIIFGISTLSDSVAIVAAVLAGCGPMGAAAALLASKMIAVATLWIIVRRNVHWLNKDTQAISLSNVRALVSPAIAAAALPMAQAAYFQGTVIVLGIAATSLAIPAFTVSRTLSRIGLQLSTMPTIAIGPIFSMASARGDTQEMRSLFGISMITGLFIALPAAAIIGIFGPEVVRLWSHDAIVAPRSLTMTLALAGFLGSIWTPLSNLLMAINKHQSYSAVYGIGTVLTIPVAYGLALWLKGTGVALAMLLLELVMVAIVVRLARRYLSPLPTIKEVLKEAKTLVATARKGVATALKA